MPEEKNRSSRPLPDEAYEDLAFIVSYADKLPQICEAVEQTKDFVNLNSLSLKVTEQTDMETEDARQLLSNLLKFQRLRSNNEHLIDDFWRWLEKPFVEFVKEQGKEYLAEAWETNSSLIKDVLDEGSALGILDKAVEILYEHQNVLKDAQLLTDLRPVYDKEATEILRMVVTHQLVLNYSDGSSDKKISLTVDSSDLDILENQCRRAREKAKVALKSMQGLGWTTYIAGESDE